MRTKWFVVLLAVLCLVPCISAQDQALANAPLLDIAHVDQLAYDTPVYGYSTLDPTGPKRFAGHLLGVMHNTIGPGHSWIAVELDASTNPVIAAGQSGSPMFVDVAGVPHKIGTLSYGESWARNPICYLTPIAEVLNTNHQASGTAPVNPQAFSMAKVLRELLPANDRMRAMLSDDVSSGVTASGPTQPTVVASGTVLGVQLAWGDFDVTPYGTVSHVDGNRVFMFGHPLLQLGPAEYRLVPMKVFKVQQSYERSFILAAPIEGAKPVGVITQDRETAVYGILGKEPEHAIPVSITLTTVSGQNKEFNFFVTADPLLAPRLIGGGIATAIKAWSRQLGDMTLFVNGKLEVEGVDAIEFGDSFTTSSGPFAMFREKISSVLDNRFSKAKITKVTVRAKVFDEYRKLSVESASVEQANVRPGDTLSLRISLSQPLRDAKTVTLQIPVPNDIQYGIGKIVVGDHDTIDELEHGDGDAVNLVSLMESLNQKRRADAIYVYVILPPSKIGPASSDAPVPLQVGDIKGEMKKTSRRLSSNVEEYQIAVGDFQVSGSKKVEFKVGSPLGDSKPANHPH